MPAEAMRFALEAITWRVGASDGSSPSRPSEAGEIFAACPAPTATRRRFKRVFCTSKSSRSVANVMSSACWVVTRPASSAISCSRDQSMPPRACGVGGAANALPAPSTLASSKGKGLAAEGAANGADGS